MRHLVPSDVHAELQNWARWSWLGEWPCEGASEPGWMGGRPPRDDDEEPEPQLPPVERRARVVQDTWIRLDEITRKVLRAEYPAWDGAGRPAAAQRIGITLAQYEDALVYGARKIKEAFDAVFA